MLGIRPAGRIKICLPSDPAVDLKHPNYSLAEFLKTLDLVHMPLREGATATWFELRKLTRRQRLHIDTLPGMAQDEAAVRYGLVGVEHLMCGEDEIRLSFRSDGDLGERLDDATMECLFASDLVGDLGTLVKQLSTLRPQ